MKANKPKRRKEKRLTALVGYRASPEVKERVKAAAERQGRTVSSFVRWMVESALPGLEAGGFNLPLDVEKANAPSGDKSSPAPVAEPETSPKSEPQKRHRGNS